MVRQWAQKQTDMHYQVYYLPATQAIDAVYKTKNSQTSNLLKYDRANSTCQIGVSVSPQGYHDKYHKVGLLSKVPEKPGIPSM